MKKLKLDFNAPVILGLTLVSAAVLALYALLGERVVWLLGARYTAWSDPMFYVRLFTHVVTHMGVAHFTGNFMLILAVGPMVEEKYGSIPLLKMMAATALVTGLVNAVFFRQTLLAGASGIVFMLILLASFVNIREGRFPLTVLLAALVFLGNEVVSGVVSADNISQLGHVVGGLCGGAFGLLAHRGRMRGG